MINTNALQPKVKLESLTLPLIAAASQLDALFAGPTPPRKIDVEKVHVMVK